MIFVYFLQKLPKFDDAFKGVVTPKVFLKDDLEAILRAILINIRGEDSHKTFGSEILSNQLLRNQLRPENSRDKTSFLYKFSRESEQKSNNRYDGKLTVEAYYGDIDFSPQFLVELSENIIEYLRRHPNIELSNDHQQFLKSVEICIEIDNYFIESGLSDLFFEITIKKSAWILNLVELFLEYFFCAFSKFPISGNETNTILLRGKDKRFYTIKESIDQINYRSNSADLTPMLEDLAGSLVVKKLRGKSLSDLKKKDIDLLLVNIAESVDKIEKIQDVYQSRLKRIYSDVLKVLQDLDQDRNKAQEEIKDVLDSSASHVEKVQDIISEAERDIITQITIVQMQRISLPRWQDILPMPNEKILELIAKKQNNE
jgi:gas vesicle protein